MPQFSINVPLKKVYKNSENGEQNIYVEGIASTTDIDRDTERLSEKALFKMKNDILEYGVNLFGNHEHDWENTLGIVKYADLRGKEFLVKFLLDDENTNPKVNVLLNKLKKGINLGLSIGGNVLETHREMNKAMGKEVTVIDDLELYEISVVGVPSNKFSRITGAMVAKSLGEKIKFPELCPFCYSKSFNVKKGIITCDYCCGGFN